MEHGRHAAHPTPMTYVKVAAILGIVTAVEVALFYVPAVGDVLVPVFIVLSAAKFALVAMYYMHLKFDERLFSMFFVGGLVLATAVISALMVLVGALLQSPDSSAGEAASAILGAV